MLTPKEQQPRSPTPFEAPVPTTTPKQPTSTLTENPLVLPRPCANIPPSIELPSSTPHSSFAERGLAAACKEFPAALPHLLRFLPVSFNTKIRVAQSVLGELPFGKALDILPRLRLPRELEAHITHQLAERTLNTVTPVECFWRAVAIKLATTPPPADRLSLALKCVGFDPHQTVKEIATFDLSTPDLQVPFARKCIQRSGIELIFTLPWLSSIGTSDPAGATELANLCISEDPFETATRLDRFGLPLHPLIEKLLDEVGARHRWKALSRVCALSSLPEDLRTALVETSFDRYPHETLRQLDIFRLPEGEPLTKLLIAGITLNPKAVVSYLQKRASPFFRHIAEQTLWSSLSKMPWEVAEIAIRVGVQDQGLLAAIIHETFQRDPKRSLRFIQVSKAFSQQTLSQLALQLSESDAVTVSRCIKRFGVLPQSTLRTIVHRVAAVAPERAVSYLTTAEYKDDESRRVCYSLWQAHPRERSLRLGTYINAIFQIHATRCRFLRHVAPSIPKLLSPP